MFAHRMASLGLGVVLAGVPLPTHAQADSRAVLAANPIVREALAGLWSSATWANALDSVQSAGGRVLVVTLPELTGLSERFAKEELAETNPVVLDDGTVPTVMVIVNIGLLQQMHSRAGGAEERFRQDLQRILIHEIYGHAVPYLLANSLSGRCADPRPGWFRGCSVDRENVVRNELNLGRRVGYDLSGLWIGSHAKPGETAAR
jgi:hypothetical protein